MTMPDVTMQTASEAASPSRWIAARVAHPVRDLDRSAAFYRDLLGLPARGGFTDHDGYSGVFFGLPGGGELELTAGPAQPRPATDDDLLVLYLASQQDVRGRAAELASAGVPTVPSANPYWNRWGQTFLDPDGYAVVVAAVEDAAAPPVRITAGPVRVELYTGERQRLRNLFELAEDSPSELDSYLHAGRVLVAVADAATVGHLQLVDTGQPGRAEVKNMAVREDLQGRGIGGRLIQAAAALVAAEGGTELLVATAAADIGNLSFYQRQGFRMRSIERDAFTPATGYPPGLRIDGIDLRDRVWLDRHLGRTPPNQPVTETTSPSTVDLAAQPTPPAEREAQ
jgi:ribosomal protein S18 acetylase RimI-like enzyme